MKRRHFLEEDERLYYGQTLDKGLKYLVNVGLFPRADSFRITKYEHANSANIILDYDEARAILNKIEFYTNRHYFKKSGLQEKKGTILFKFEADETLNDYFMHVQIEFKNRLADSKLTKGQYKLIVTFI